MKIWIVIARSCFSCGSTTAYRVCSTMPSEALIDEVKDALGEMYCITVKVLESVVDGPPMQEEEEC